MAAIKQRLTTLDGLPEAIAALYVKDADDVFRLDTDGEDVGALKRSKEHEVAARKAAEKKAADALTALDELRATVEDDKAGGHRKKGDVAALEASWAEKLAKAEKKAADALAAANGHLHSLLVDNVAANIAGEISVSPELMLPHIKARLTVEQVDGRPVTRVLDADGKPSALTPDELKQNFIADKRFAPIIRASRGSGGGAGGSGDGGKGGGAADLAQYKDGSGNVLWGKVAAAVTKDPSIKDRLMTAFCPATPAA